MLVGRSVGNVRGSLVWDDISGRLEFLASGGPLAPDTYTLTLASRADGLVGTSGQLLDSNSDGSPGGDYVYEFVVAASSDRVVGLADFVRAPRQPVELAGTGGIPIRIE